MKNDYAFSRLDAWVAFGLIVVATASRAYGLGRWDFLVDEFATFYYADERMTSLNAPAYYAIVHTFFQLFGATELTTRIPAMVFGVLSVPVFYLTWRNIIGRYGAAIGAILILLSSWHLWYSQFGRFYSALFFFGSLSFYYFWRAITTDDLRKLFLFALTTLIGVSFHFTMVMVAGACGVFSLLVLLMHKRLGTTYSHRIAKLSVVVCMLAGLVMIPVVWTLLGNWDSLGQQWGYGPSTFLLQVVKYIQIPICAVAFFGLIQLARNDPGKGLFILVALAVPVGALLTVSGFVSARPDYMFFAYPLVFVAVGYACSEMLTAVGRGLFMPHILGLVLVSTAMPEFVSHYTGHSSVDIRDAIAFIEKNGQPDDRVLPFVSGFDYYSETDRRIETRLGGPYDNTITWLPILDEYAIHSDRLWIVVPAGRQRLNASFERWLGENASLVWRRYEARYDYTFRGYEIFLVPQPFQEGGSN